MGEWWSRAGRVTALVTLGVASVAAPGWSAPPAVTGIWRTADNKAAVEIKPCGDSVCGRLIWFIPDPGAGDVEHDANNPDPSKRGRKLCGLDMLGGFKADDDSWTGGWIYDPKSGNTYKARMSRDGARLRLRGYVGIALFGRTEIWSPAPQDQPRCG